ncbi:MAG: shikimate kinase [Desulfovibrio sp. S3730MH75]|nr:MAG: shikimate kinase [Desulfovibrio sp. S3730MH75]
MSNRDLKFSEASGVSLIGMAGAGKSTLAPLLADKLDWKHLDTDLVIEAFYGKHLQDVVDYLGVDKFRETEDEILSTLGAIRMVVSTGGSVIYGARAMENLQRLGPVIYLRIDCKTCLDRVGKGGGRGLAKGPDQSLEALYNERVPIYERYADFTIDTDKFSSDECAEQIAQWLKSIQE